MASELSKKQSCMKWHHLKNSSQLLETFHMLFPLLLMNIHLKQNETFKNKVRSYRTDWNWRIFTNALKYISSKHSYEKQLLVFYLLKSVYFVLLSVWLENSLVSSWIGRYWVRYMRSSTYESTAELNYSGQPKKVLSWAMKSSTFEPGLTQICNLLHFSCKLVKELWTG